MQWGAYGCIAVALAAPQLFGFAFQQASESGMVQLHFNWANEVDSFLWFYGKNLGWLFLLMPFALLLLSKKDREIALGFMVLWLVSETVIFQPNNYDNNKLLFVWFFCLCGLTAKLLGVLNHRLACRFRFSPVVRLRALSLLGCFASALGLVIYATGFTHLADGTVYLPAFGVVTEIFLLAFLVYLSIQVYAAHHSRESDAWAGILLGLTTILGLYLLYRLIGESSQSSLPVSLSLALLLLFWGLSITLLFLSLYMSQGRKDPACRNIYACRSLLAFLLGFSLFISGPMTILREWRSSYMLFSNADIQAADYIRENTDPKGLFLTDYSWHLNAVSVLTGRSIVCGPDLFLYYHGIDTRERREDIDTMFKTPWDNGELFEKYGIRYVYIGSAERSKYDIDMDFFETNGTLLYDEDGIQIFELK